MFHLHIPEPGDRLDWIGDEPSNEDGEAAYAVIVTRDEHDAARVARGVADLLARRDLERYGPSSDAGFFRRWYLVEAYRLLGRLDGTEIRTTRPVRRG